MRPLNGLKAILAALVYKNYFISSTKFCNAVINKNSTKSSFLKLTQPKEFNGRENTPKHSFSLLIQFRVQLLQGERQVTLCVGHQFFTGLTQRHRPFTLIHLLSQLTALTIMPQCSLASTLHLKFEASVSCVYRDQ